MESKEICADLIMKANALEAVATVFSDTFASGSEEDIVRSVAAQPSTFSYLIFVVSDYINSIVKKAEDLEASFYCEQ